MALRNFEAVGALLDVHLGVQLPVHMLHSPEQWSENVSRHQEPSRGFKFSRREGVLAHVARFCIKPLLDAYLLTPSSQMEVEDSYFGGKALPYAVTYGHEAVVKLLLATGQVDLESKCTSGRTPLSYAVRNGQEAVVKLLIATGQVNIESKSNSGQTPLSYAARNGHEAVVKLLIATGQVDINSTDVDGVTALQHARASFRKSIVEILEQAGGK